MTIKKWIQEYTLYFFIIFCLFILSRILYLFKLNKILPPTKRNRPLSIFIMIGSGGHTTEMLKLVKDNVNITRFSPRYYIKSITDVTSEARIADFEGSNNDFQIVNIPRCRNVHQSYISSIWTTLVALFFSFPPLLKYRPEMILCNGPGTCFPICYVAFVLKIFFLLDTKIIFVESFCRVRTLSLTGRLLLHFSDYVIVQWPELKEKYPKTIYLGRITL